MIDEKQMKNQMLDSINDNFVPDVSNKVKMAYEFNSLKRKATPWYRNKLFISVATPSACMACLAAIIIPTMYFSVTRFVNFVDKHDQLTLATYSACNAFYVMARTDDGDEIVQGNINGSLKQDIQSINRYMFTAESLLGNGLKPSELPRVQNNANHTYNFDFGFASVSLSETMADVDGESRLFYEGTMTTEFAPLHVVAWRNIKDPKNKAQGSNFHFWTYLNDEHTDFLYYGEEHNRDGMGFNYSLTLQNEVVDDMSVNFSRKGKDNLISFAFQDEDYYEVKMNKEKTLTLSYKDQSVPVHIYDNNYTYTHQDWCLILPRK